MKLNKYLADGLMIVFSVLFALFINKMAENYQVHKDKVVAEKNILNELTSNKKIIEEWRSIHNLILNKLQEIKNDENHYLYPTEIYSGNNFPKNY